MLFVVTEKGKPLVVWGGVEQALKYTAGEGQVTVRSGGRTFTITPVPAPQPGTAGPANPVGWDRVDTSAPDAAVPAVAG